MKLNLFAEIEEIPQRPAEVIEKPVRSVYKERNRKGIYCIIFNNNYFGPKKKQF